MDFLNGLAAGWLVFGSSGSKMATSKDRHSAPRPPQKNDDDSGAGWALAALAIVGVVVMGACLDLPGSSTTVITNTATNNQGPSGPTPGASPSPASGPIDHVKVTQFGESCGEKERNITVGCTKFITCTPFFADGTLVPPAVHGAAPEFFGVIEGANFVQVTTPDEQFNRDCKGLFPGIVKFECVVKGVSSGPSEFIVVPAP